MTQTTSNDSIYTSRSPSIGSLVFHLTTYPSNRTRKAFTLTEMLTALAVGMFVLNIAFASFFFTQKFIRKTEMIGAKNDCAQALIMWTMTGRAQAISMDPNAQFRGVHCYLRDTSGPGASEFMDGIVYSEFTIQAKVDITATKKEISVRGNHGLAVGHKVELYDPVHNKRALATVLTLKGTSGFTCELITGPPVYDAPGFDFTDADRVRPVLGRVCIPKVWN